MSNSLQEMFKNISAEDLAYAKAQAEIMTALAHARNGMTQKEFAKKLGVSQGMVSKWESGDYNFTISKLCELSQKIDVTFSISLKNNSYQNVATFRDITTVKANNKNINTDVAPWNNIAHKSETIFREVI